MTSEMELVLQWRDKGFTVHRGWPTHEGPVKMKAAKMYYILGLMHSNKKLMKNLGKIWPTRREGNTNDKVWMGEWQDHGPFSGMQKEEYFQSIVDVLLDARMAGSWAVQRHAARRILPIDS